MKKVVIISIFIISVFFISGCNKKENTNDNNQVEQKEEITQVNFVCDELDNIKDINEEYLLNNDGEIYEFSFNQLFSNDMNCKKVETSIKFSKLLGSDFFEGENGRK